MYMKLLRCPVCREPLQTEGRIARCANGHAFDFAKEGYLNLLAGSHKAGSATGDSRTMALARRAFLDKGYFAPLRAAAAESMERFAAHGAALDICCGEGYYSARLAAAIGAPLTGLDISKEAVRSAAGQYKAYAWLCATAAHIPVPDGSVGTLSSLFALTLPGEFRRVLRKNGLFLQVLAAEDHLLGLKSIVYDVLTHKQKDTAPALPGFALLESRQIRFDFTAEGEQVQRLFAMTPHLFRIGKAGAQRLAETAVLHDTASCVLNVYRAI